MIADLGKTGSAFLFIGRPRLLSPPCQGWICKNLQSAAMSPDGQARPLSPFACEGATAPAAPQMIAVFKLVLFRALRATNRNRGQRS